MSSGINRSDIALSVRGLSKVYTIAHNEEKHVTLAEAALHRLKNPFQRSQKESFWALKDIDFDIEKGDVVGIIGRNGAGKSTLLKILSRITEPTTGEINLYGRVGSLLEVGTGFHPELTGRENIYLNGAILGMRRREIDRQFDAIVQFAEVERFLDTPVKRYSSGMYVRLAFAVAAHLNPEILVVDEVLAVGDAAFQKKCLGKMQDVSRQEGKTVLFVSHNMAAVSKLCRHALLIKSGQAEGISSTEETIEKYLSGGSEGHGEVRWVDSQTAPGAKKGKIVLRGVRILDSKFAVTGNIDIRYPMYVEIEYELLQAMEGLRVYFLLSSSEGTVVFTTMDHDVINAKRRAQGIYTSRCELPGNFLNTGQYHVTAGADVPQIDTHFQEQVLHFFVEQTGGVSGETAGFERWAGVICPNLHWCISKLG